MAYLPKQGGQEEEAGEMREEAEVRFLATVFGEFLIKAGFGLPNASFWLSVMK